MTTEEKKELNIDRKTLQRKENAERKKEQEELKESFKKIFYRTTAGEFKMPFNLAWKNFEMLAENRGGISAQETDRITSFCKVIRKEYFKSKGLDVLFMDNNGNPRLSITLDENPNFLRENPEFAENVDIKSAIENRVIEQKMRELMLEESTEEFLSKLGLLNQEEKDGIFQKILSEDFKITREEKEEYDRISKEAKKRDLTEKEKEIIYNNKIKSGLNIAHKKIEQKEKLNIEDRLAFFDYAAQFIYSNSEEDKKKMFLTLSYVMTQEELEQFKISPSMGYKLMLSKINSITDGSYESIDEFKEKRKEKSVEEFKKEHNILSDTVIEEDELDFEFELLEENKEYLQMNESSVRAKLKTPLEKKIFRNIQDIDFSTDENALMFIKLYLDYKDEEKFFEDGAKFGYTIRRDTFQAEKLKAIENVFEMVIFAEENAGKFGDYIDIDSKGEPFINTKKVEKNIEPIGEVYKELKSDTLAYIVRRKREAEDTPIAKSFGEAEKRIQSDEKIQGDLLKKFSYKKAEYEKAFDEKTRNKINIELLEIERKLMKLKDYTLFFVNGRFDYDAFQKHVERQGKPDYQLDSKTEKIIIEFSKVSYRKMLRVDKHLEESDKKRRHEVYNEIYSDGDFEKYNEIYKELIEKYSEKTAIENLYRPFLKGRKLDDMTDVKKDRFISSLGYLYISENPDIRKFANEMIKYTFPNIKINNEGSVDKKEFASIFKSFYREDLGLENAKEIFERKIAIPLSKQEKIDFSKIDIDVNLEKLNTHLEHINEERTKKSQKHFFNKYDEEELKTIKKVKDLDLTDSSNVDAIVIILAKFENDDMRLSTEYAALKDFIFSSQNRRYFSKYIEKSRLKTEDVPITADPDTVNIDLIKEFGLEDKIEIGKPATAIANFEEEMKYQEVKSLLDSVYLYANTPEILEKRLKKLALWENESLDIFKKDEKLDIEKLEKIYNKISGYVQNDDARNELVAILAKNFTTNDAMREYITDYSSFVDESYKIIKDISERDAGIIKEDRSTDADARIENLEEQEELTWEEYLAKRPEGTEEDLRRLEEREALRKQREEQTHESKTEIQENDMQKPISDGEFSKYMAAQKENIADIAVSEKIRKPKINSEEKVDFQSADFAGNNITVEEITTGFAEKLKKDGATQMGIVDIIKNGFQNLFNRTKRLPTLNESKRKNTLLNSLKNIFVRKGEVLAEIPISENVAIGQKQSTFTQDGFYQNVNTVDAIKNSNNRIENKSTTALIAERDEE